MYWITYIENINQWIGSIKCTKSSSQSRSNHFLLIYFINHLNYRVRMMTAIKVKSKMYVLHISYSQTQFVSFPSINSAKSSFHFCTVTKSKCVLQMLRTNIFILSADFEQYKSKHLSEQDYEITFCENKLPQFWEIFCLLSFPNKLQSHVS